MPPPRRRTRIEKLGTLFARRAASKPAAIALLAELLSIPHVAAAPSSLTPAQRKASTLALIVDEFLCLGENQADVLIVLEDAHWIDATTLEMMMRLIRQHRPGAALAVVTARPDFAPPWLARPQSTLLTLGRLGRQECAQLVAGRRRAWPVGADRGGDRRQDRWRAAVRRGIDQKRDGIGGRRRRGAGHAQGFADGPSRPSRRSARSGPDRRRHRAAVQSFAARRRRLAGDELETTLAKLVAAGIVFPEERSLERGFSFKHALVRDAAYESLLLTRRREWHERIASALEETFPEITTREPDLLAHHFGEAGLLGPASDYRMRAGDQAVSRSAYPEATAHFSAGLKLAETSRRRRGCIGNWIFCSSSARRRLSRRHAKRRGRGSVPPRQRDRREAGGWPRIISGQMGPVDQCQYQAQDGAGA